MPFRTASHLARHGASADIRCQAYAAAQPAPPLKFDAVLQIVRFNPPRNVHERDVPCRAGIIPTRDSSAYKRNTLQRQYNTGAFRVWPLGISRATVSYCFCDRGPLSRLSQFASLVGFLVVGKHDRTATRPQSEICVEHLSLAVFFDIVV